MRSNSRENTKRSTFKSGIINYSFALALSTIVAITSFQKNPNKFNLEDILHKEKTELAGMSFGAGYTFNKPFGAVQINIPDKYIKRTHQFRKYLIKQVPKSKEFINALFNNESIGLDNRVDSLINGTGQRHKKSMTYQEFLDYINIDDLKEKGVEFYEKHKSTLLDIYKKTGVDPRAIVAHYGIESRYGKITGTHNWFNTLLTHYVKGRRSKDIRFGMREGKALIKLTDQIWHWSPDSLMTKKSSYKAAYSGAQYIPTAFLSLYRGEDGTLENSNPSNVTDNLYAIAYYLKNNGRHNWKPWLNGRHWRNIEGNRLTTWVYNHSRYYNNVIWLDIMPTIPFRTEKEMEEYTYDTKSDSQNYELLPKAAVKEKSSIGIGAPF